jgi:hypothetical protein
MLIIASHMKIYFVFYISSSIMYDDAFCNLYFGCFSYNDIILSLVKAGGVDNISTDKITTFVYGRQKKSQFQIVSNAIQLLAIRDILVVFF